MKQQHWVFLSPHFDDAALSCGGLVWHLTQAGHRVEIWTLMGGFPPDENYSSFAVQNHRAWGKSGEEAIRMRQAEDRGACQVLGAQARHFDWADAIYRRAPQSGEPIVTDNQTLFSAPPEEALVAEMAETLQAELSEGALLVCPLGIGKHIDHRTVALAAEQSGRINFYYADYPYILNSFDEPGLQAGVWEQLPLALGQEALQAWQDAVLCYTSQWPGFWRDEMETRMALQNYLAGSGGRLWVK